ncbi:MAG: 3-hydroxyacyl-CoA dehydrogenase/enoyl-CoA hydratase/3-hydroxybutyryl-CoA epimerase, partial [Chitinophagales bacterium]
MYNGSALSVKMLEGGIAEMNFDLQGESVNKFDSKTVNELSEAVKLLDNADDVKGLLLTSAKPVFIVGADITEFIPMFASGKHTADAQLGGNNESFNMIEDFDFPTVVAINGYAMGGGLEICLACDFRVMSSDAKVGLPETKLGLVPGWGGTVRLPRIVGADTAIDWIASGQEQRPDAALKAGVVDGVVAPEDLRDAALAVLQDAIDGKMDYEARRNQKTEPLMLNETESMMVFETAKGFVAGTAGPNYPAPVAAISAMQHASRKYRDDALKIEADTFIKMAATDTASALIGIFLADQLIGKKAKGWAKQADKKIERAAVLGAGIMGGGIAYQSALKGTPIRMKDINQAGLDLGLDEANGLLAKQVNRGRMKVEKMGSILADIDPTLSYDNFKSVDIVVEAVVENPKVKHMVLADVEKNVNEDAIIASNTSTISITYLAEALERPENFCGMHFFNP